MGQVKKRIAVVGAGGADINSAVLNALQAKIGDDVVLVDANDLDELPDNVMTEEELSDTVEARGLLSNHSRLIDELRYIEDAFMPAMPKRLRGVPVYPVTPRMTTGRNDFCPCGSGKKFKKCCINKIK